MTVAYLAAEGYESQLAEELHRAAIRLAQRHGRLFVSPDAAVPAAWALNTWYDAEYLPVKSIKDAASALRDRQRGWALYAPYHRGRAKLIAERLPHVSAKPLDLGCSAPGAPLGSWTLIAPNLLLAAATCSSPFPNGEVAFVEDRHGPPSRAYLKLWEALVRVGRWPGPGDRCLDLGASPGGWTWTLASLGADVVAVDKAPLDPVVDAMGNVTWQNSSAFALDPVEFGPVDWLCSDVIAYPKRILSLVERWHQPGGARNLVLTVKFQGDTDHDAARAFTDIPRAQVFHMHHNRHELTFALVDD